MFTKLEIKTKVLKYLLICVKIIYTNYMLTKNSNLMKSYFPKTKKKSVRRVAMF